jgi:RsiW-degrading membrane proteinase PrsW (M82 family)
MLLAALMYLDSYKLVRLRRVAGTIALGGIAAAFSYFVNGRLLSVLPVDLTYYSRYVAPLIEESAKGLIIAYLVRSGRTGFLVDASILGFAAGSGFALVENAYYLQALRGANITLWVIRGFGTAVMHGGTTAILGISSQLLAERRSRRRLSNFVPGLLLAAVLHSLFNHLFLPPAISALAVLLAFPPIIYVVFIKSELWLQQWLEVGFDADAELLRLIQSGRLSESRVGRFLESLRQRFSGEVVVDILCYIRIRVELTLRAKGILMMRESGFEVPSDEETRAKFAELEHLERSIGKTGKLAILPIFHMGGKDLWQLHMLR